MSSRGIASVRQLELPLVNPGDEAASGTGGEDAPVGSTDPSVSEGRCGNPGRHVGINLALISAAVTGKIDVREEAVS